MTNTLLTFAQVYGAGTYDSSTYAANNSTTTGTTGTTTSTGTTTAPATSTKVLTDTGFDIAMAVTLASVLIFAALVVRFWRKPVKQEVSDN